MKNRKKLIVIAVVILLVGYLLYPKTYELPGASILGPFAGERCIGFSYDFGYKMFPDGGYYEKCIGLVLNN